MKRINLEGAIFGRLSVMYPTTDKRWMCVCICGVRKEILSGHLRSGKTKSCGCLLKDSPNSGRFVRSHGEVKTRIYKVWTRVKYRCSDKNNMMYGGRGISLCDRWNKFENFRDDMIESYNKHVAEYGERETTIDRIDSNGNYEPSNCRWATWKEQSANRRPFITRYKDKPITYDGRTMNIKQWCNETGLSRGSLWHRISVLKWTVDKALSTPPLRIRRRQIA